MFEQIQFIEDLSPTYMYDVKLHTLGP